MHYYKFNIKDWTRDTAPLWKRGRYRRPRPPLRERKADPTRNQVGYSSVAISGPRRIGRGDFGEFFTLNLTGITIIGVTKRSRSTTRKRLQIVRTEAVAGGQRNPLKTQVVPKTNPTITLTKNH